MTNRIVERMRVIIGGIITIFTSFQLFKLGGEISNERICSNYSIVAIVFLCLGIFGIIMAITKEPNERMWSSHNIKARVVSDVIVVFIVCFIPFDAIMGDIYRYIDEFLIVFKNMALYTSISGLIFDGIHTYLRRNTQANLNNELNRKSPSASDKIIHNKEDSLNIKENSVLNMNDDSMAQKKAAVVSTTTCSSCGYEQPAGRKVCWKCAKPFINMVESPLEDIKEEVSENRFCINCGREINSADVFCAYCGEKVLKSDASINKQVVEHTGILCPSCGGKVEVGDVFCINCGSQINN